MIKKGDMVSIALIMANVVFVCLLVTKGSFIAQDIAAGNDSVNSSLPATIIPDITLTTKGRPSPTITLAVNEGALLFAEIRSQPRQASSAPAVSPSPSPMPDMDDDDRISPVKKSYPKTPTIQPDRKTPKGRSGHRK